MVWSVVTSSKHDSRDAQGLDDCGVKGRVNVAVEVGDIHKSEKCDAFAVVVESSHFVVAKSSRPHPCVIYGTGFVRSGIFEFHRLRDSRTMPSVRYRERHRQICRRRIRPSFS